MVRAEYFSSALFFFKFVKNFLVNYYHLKFFFLYKFLIILLKVFIEKFTKFGGSQNQIAKVGKALNKIDFFFLRVKN